MVIRVEDGGKFPVSFEVYPPRNLAAAGTLVTTINELATVDPQFISVTFGAGGSSRRNSIDVLSYIRDHTHVEPLAHITCVGHTHAESAEIVREFLAAGITSFLALRGDVPAGEQNVGELLGDIRSASELVQLITNVQSERVPWTEAASLGSSRGRIIDPTPGSVTIAVAAFPNGHPESGSTRRDIDSLLAKEAAGADFAITQLFFHADDYFRFVDKARSAGVTMPIIPGIMPITSHSRLMRVVELSGEKEPSELSITLQVEPDAAVRTRAGVDYAIRLASDLVAGGAPAIHLYAFNRHDTVLDVVYGAGLRATTKEN
ncbi:MAG: hypothetical protein RLZZ319_682 [Actinomycetota bacterium]